MAKTSRARTSKTRAAPVELAPARVTVATPKKKKRPRAVSPIHETLAALRVRLDSVKRHPGNPRRHDLKRIKESLRGNGQFRPIVINRRTMTVLAGNGTHEAAEQLGWTEIAATMVDVDEQAASKILAADNRASDMAGYDDAVLLELLAGLADLSGTGYTATELAALERAVRGPIAKSDPDHVPEPPAKPVSRLGDLWHLGPHRLLAGDAVKRDDVARLLDGRRPDIVVTDPPYGVAYGGKKNDPRSIIGDLTQAVIPIAFAVSVEVLSENGRIYCFGSNRNWTTYAGLFDFHLGMHVKPIIWVKDGFVLSHHNYHSQFEMVYFGWKGRGGGKDFWFGDRKQSDVWQITREPTAAKVHPTQKPVEVCAIPIRNSCPPDGLVYEPFAGSGSTIIAAHGLGRLCYAMEFDTLFVDVMCRRYQEHTGTAPILDATGKPHDFTVE